ncbi:glycoside hydrolase family 97 protein [Parvularcula lutaonensis]|uniref:Glycoside hydrolase family 97 protein n=1 Tax=Parvularcula lutaonensis TaxID=491923 RepID=A0ABV7M9V2_9PROT|nr:glycoside hydrolase family 97 protein [Parvularcula lutaonensis]GGY45449.1 alpha-glucosidase [Parvularcula lutaonensis]
MFRTMMITASALGLAHAVDEIPPISFDRDVSYSVTSPDGDIEITAFTNAYGEPMYEVTFEGEAVIEPSRLGMRFADHQQFKDGLLIGQKSTNSHDETWEQPWGERRFVRDHHNEMVVTFRDADDERRSFDVRFRAFDDGIGFRYEFPKQRSLRGELAITDELTEFRIPAEDTTAFHIGARLWNRYEYLYETTPVSGMQMVHTPVTFELGSGDHIAIHEAALVDYSGMSLLLKRGNVLEADLAPRSDGPKVKKRAPFNTPWRTVQIAEDAPGLVNGTDIYLNLNEPNVLGDVSWVAEDLGVYTGIWWDMHIRTKTWGSGPFHGATTEYTKEMIDFAAENGMVGVLVEGWNEGWDGDWYNAGDVMDFTKPYPDWDIKEVTDYALSKGVRIIGHHETVGNIGRYEDQLEEALDLYQEHGITQVKSGYVADAGNLKWTDRDGIEHFEFHDGQRNSNHHIKVLKEAAERKIAMNPHEPIKDTGLRRTYPNWITREGARGMEYSAWGVPPNVPEHTAILPYTRLLSGPMDYTPGIFDLKPNINPNYVRVSQNSPESEVQTTLAKQLALYVVIYSPIQMAPDLPQNYRARPDEFQFIKDVPTNWEESIALAGEVGDYIVQARKDWDSDDWYIGAVTDENERTVEIDLSFLDDGKTYTAQIYRDAEDAHWDDNPYATVIEEREVTSEDAMSLYMAPGGGAAIRFKAEG